MNDSTAEPTRELRLITQHKQVSPRTSIPLNAPLTVLAISLLISALNFGSVVALGAIISLSNTALLFSYILSIGSNRLKRWRDHVPLPRRWSLSPWGGIK